MLGMHSGKKWNETGHTNIEKWHKKIVTMEALTISLGTRLVRNSICRSKYPAAGMLMSNAVAETRFIIMSSVIM